MLVRRFPTCLKNLPLSLYNLILHLSHNHHCILAACLLLALEFELALLQPSFLILIGNLGAGLSLLELFDLGLISTLLCAPMKVFLLLIFSPPFFSCLISLLIFQLIFPVLPKSFYPLLLFLVSANTSKDLFLFPTV